VAIALAWFFLREPETPPPAVTRVDVLGLALMVVGVGGLQIALDRGHRLDWFDSAEITVLVAVGVVGLIAFVVRELWVAEPLVDLRVLASRTFAIGTALVTLIGFGLYSSFVLLSVYLGNLLRYDAQTVGAVMAPGGAGSLISLLVVGRLVNRVDPRWLVSIGAAIIAYSLALMASLSLAVDFWTILWSRFVQGVGMGLVFVPLTTMSLGVVPARRMATATGIFNVVRNLGASVGIAVLTTMLSRHTQTHQAELASHVTAWSPAATARLALLEDAYRGAGADAFTAQAQALEHVYGEIQRQAAMKAFVDDFQVLAALFVVFVPLVWCMARAPAHGETHAEGVEPA
jgi:DHA2 family multidrug resistance protein